MDKKLLEEVAESIKRERELRKLHESMDKMGFLSADETAGLFEGKFNKMSSAIDRILQILKILILSLIYNVGYSQNIKDIINVIDVDQYPVGYWEDKNIIILNSVPHEMTYLVELDSSQYVSTIELDRNITGITVSTYSEGSHTFFSKKNPQTFVVNRRIQYFFIKYAEETKVYIQVER